MKEKYNITNENVLGKVERVRKMGLANKGKHHSPSTEFKKGIIPWISGKHHNKESIEKSRQAHLGKKLSPESIRKRTETRRRLYLEGKLIGGMKGKHQSIEARRLIGIASRNRIVSDATRKKLSNARLGTHPSKETLKKLSESHKGHIHTEEHKAKIRASALRGDKCHLWRGGITPLSEFIRKSLQYKKWMNACMKRDNWSCCTCHQRGGDLHVHHIKLFSDILKNNMIKTREQARLCEQLWNINNGVTLCEGCHDLTHNYLKEVKKKNNSLKPLITYTIIASSTEMKGGHNKN
jgi:hypothetical protein